MCAQYTGFFGQRAMSSHRNSSYLNIDPRRPNIVQLYERIRMKKLRNEIELMKRRF